MATPKWLLLPVLLILSFKVDTCVSNQGGGPRLQLIDFGKTGDIEIRWPQDEFNDDFQNRLASLVISNNSTTLISFTDKFRHNEDISTNIIWTSDKDFLANANTSRINFIFLPMKCSQRNFKSQLENLSLNLQCDLYFLDACEDQVNVDAG